MPAARFSLHGADVPGKIRQTRTAAILLFVRPQRLFFSRRGRTLSMSRALLLWALALLLVPFAPGAAMAWNAAPSQPVSAIFYPGEVQVAVEERLAPEPLMSGGLGFLLALPPGVQRDSFLVAVDGVSAGGYYWLDASERESALARLRSQPLPSGALLPEHENSPERRALLQRYVSLAEETARQEGLLESASHRLEAWKKALSAVLLKEEAREVTSSKSSFAEELGRLDEAVSKRLPDLYLEQARYRRALDDARQRLARARTELEQYDHKKGGELVVVPYTGNSPEARLLRYQYVLPASCSLSYRLAATPDKGSLNIAQDVALAQFSGFAWEQTEVFVSTLRRDRTLQPLLVRPWTIVVAEKQKFADRKFKHEVELAESYAPQSAVNRLPMAPSVKESAPPAPPQQEERASFRLWHLGRQRIEHKTPMRLALASDDYKARYYYTLRPATNPKGFLTAEIALPTALELPPGQAQFSVDGLAIGQQSFSFNGDKGIIFFGSDPQVTATVRDVKRSTGEQGLISKEATWLWHWRIRLQNTRSKAVEVLLEDPAPVSVAESVSIIVDSSPAPELVINPPEHGGARLYRWKTLLKPGEPVIIDHKVRVSAPTGKTMELRPGR